MPGLSDRDQRLLDFERTWWRYDADRDTALRHHLGMSAGDYHQALSELIDRPEALDYDAPLVRRLRRQRAERTRQRAARRGSVES